MKHPHKEQFSSLARFYAALRAAAVAAEELLLDRDVTPNRKLRVAHLIGLARYLGRDVEILRGESSPLDEPSKREMDLSATRDVLPPGSFIDAVDYDG